MNKQKKQYQKLYNSIKYNWINTIFVIGQATADK